MGLLTPNDIQDFRSLYTLQLRYLLSTENQIVKGLKSMMTHASDEQLKGAFQSHMQETEIQAQRLEQMISDMNGEIDDKKCAVTAALLASGENIVSESKAGPVRDAGLLASAQKVEHFEMASYGSAREWANILGLHEHAAALEKTLNEEKHANELLNTISQRMNPAAATAQVA